MHHSIWLRPSDPFLDGFVAELTGRFDAPRFLPHVTLLKASSVPSIAGFAPEVELVFERLEITDDPAIVLRAAPSAAFDELSAQAADRFGGVTSAPHLSLIYFPVDPNEALRVCKEHLDLPLTLRFDRAELWNTIAELSQHPVERWERLE